MRIATSVLAALLVLSFQSAYSATEAQQAQQDKMKTCNADATTKQLKGDERKAFMKTCLGSSGTAEHKELTPQQQKMSTCLKS